MKLGGLRDTTMRRNAVLKANAAERADRVAGIVLPLREAGRPLRQIAEHLNRGRRPDGQRRALAGFAGKAGTGPGLRPDRASVGHTEPHAPNAGGRGICFLSAYGCRHAGPQEISSRTSFYSGLVTNFSGTFPDLKPHPNRQSTPGICFNIVICRERMFSTTHLKYSILYHRYIPTKLSQAITRDKHYLGFT